LNTLLKRVLTAGLNRLLARMSSTALVAKVQMDSIVSQLGSEYTRDILAWLRSRELTTPGCRQQSPQLASRRHLVEWSTEVAGKLSLSAATLHLALRIVDLFMDGHDIQEPQLYLVCLGALLLASKMEERQVAQNIILKSILPFQRWNYASVQPVEHVCQELFPPR